MLKKILIVTTSLLCLLLLIDIVTGIWYWNRMNLVFDSSIFNNLVTPMAAIISVPIYSLALFTTMKQNKIIVSQNIKPHFEREIDQLIISAKTTYVDEEIGQNHTPDELNALSFPSLFMKVFHRLTSNEEYKNDRWYYEKGEEFVDDDLKDRSYVPQVLFLMQFTLPISSLYFFHGEVKSLMIDINKSKLTEDDKSLLKRRIKKDLLEQYIGLVSFIDKNETFNPLIPFMYGMAETVKFDRLTNTAFRIHYGWFTEEFKKDDSSYDDHSYF